MESLRVKGFATFFCHPLMLLRILVWESATWWEILFLMRENRCNRNATGNIAILLIKLINRIIEFKRYSTVGDCGINNSYLTVLPFYSYTGMLVILSLGHILKNFLICSSHKNSSIFVTCPWQNLSPKTMGLSQHKVLLYSNIN